MSENLQFAQTFSSLGPVPLLTNTYGSFPVEEFQSEFDDDNHEDFGEYNLVDKATQTLASFRRIKVNFLASYHSSQKFEVQLIFSVNILSFQEDGLRSVFKAKENVLYKLMVDRQEQNSIETPDSTNSNEEISVSSKSLSLKIAP